LLLTSSMIIWGNGDKPQVSSIERQEIINSTQSAYPEINARNSLTIDFYDGRIVVFDAKGEQVSSPSDREKSTDLRVLTIKPREAKQSPIREINATLERLRKVSETPGDSTSAEGYMLFRRELSQQIRECETRLRDCEQIGAIDAGYFGGNTGLLDFEEAFTRDTHMITANRTKDRTEYMYQALGISMHARPHQSQVNRDKLEEAIRRSNPRL
jgi:hypothetical protein